MPPKKTASKSQESLIDEDCSMCYKCDEILILDSSKYISCERCFNSECIDCADIDVDTFDYINTRKHIHFYCDDCEAAAMKAVQTDNLIEVRCKEILSRFEERLTTCENKLENKAEKMYVENLEQRIISLESKLANHVVEISKLEKKVELVRFEPYEKEKRAKNVIFHGIPETGIVERDRFIISSALADLGCQNISPEEVTRLGDHTKKAQVDVHETFSAKSQDQKVRPIRISLKSKSDKSDILRNSKNIRKSRSKFFDPKKSTLPLT